MREWKLSRCPARRTCTPWWTTGRQSTTASAAFALRPSRNSAGSSWRPSTVAPRASPNGKPSTPPLLRRSKSPTPASDSMVTHLTVVKSDVDSIVPKSTPVTDLPAPSGAALLHTAGGTKWSASSSPGIASPGKPSPLTGFDILYQAITFSENLDGSECAGGRAVSEESGEPRKKRRKWMGKWLSVYMRSRALLNIFSIVDYDLRIWAEIFWGCSVFSVFLMVKIPAYTKWAKALPFSYGGPLHRPASYFLPVPPLVFPFSSLSDSLPWLYRLFTVSGSNRVDFLFDLLTFLTVWSVFTYVVRV